MSNLTPTSNAAISPSEIIEKLPNAFKIASEVGDLLFFPSTVEFIRDEALKIEFEIRLCPALQKKPHSPKPHFDPNTKSQDELPIQPHNGGRADPFSPPYIENLHVGELETHDEYDGQKGYVVLLNKYSVIPHHFLLVTKDFVSQASPLFPDLLPTYRLLLAARNASKPQFAFYNCGDKSGASQPHKHIQFIPLEGEGPPIERLAKATKLENGERPFTINSLPYANHVFRLPYLSSSTLDLEQTLQGVFGSLFELVVSTVRHDPTYPIGLPSFNALMTLEHMHLIPRKFETHTLKETGEELSVNALGFAGMLLVKSEKEMEAVRKEGVGSILGSVGVQSVHDIQVAGASLEATDAEGDTS